MFIKQLHELDNATIITLHLHIGKCDRLPVRYAMAIGYYAAYCISYFTFNIFA